MHILRAGHAALLIECDSPADVPACYRALLDRRAAGDLRADEIVPAARTILLDGVPDPARLMADLRTLRPAPAGDASAGALTTVDIPTVYDGPDLDDVARLWGTDRAGVVAIHAGSEFTVAFCGFAPGFAYLSGLPERYHVPRRATPRARVPAGTVALAGEFGGVYPTASPGGWQCIGHTDLRLFDLDTDPPAVLIPGARVRFVPQPGQ
jgi:KipI family sensor histidine kinase inhibitor